MKFKGYGKGRSNFRPNESLIPIKRERARGIPWLPSNYGFSIVIAVDQVTAVEGDLILAGQISYAPGKGREREGEGMRETRRNREGGGNS